MIEPLKPKGTLKSAELQDGDVICFQEAQEANATSEATADKAMQDP